jgi:N-acetylglutamate synthase-like GNAT family acetyltransferase
VASRLCAEVETRAASLGARRVFLLTETAEAFFVRRGYARLGRSLAPPGIAASREFSALCPASAILMFREL